MEITPDPETKRLLVQLTDGEWAGLSAAGPGALTALNTYAANFLINVAEQIRQEQRAAIAVLLASADFDKLAAVMGVLTPAPEEPPVEEEEEPVVEPQP